MKIDNGNNNNRSKEIKEKFKQLVADKKTRWIVIAFPIMVIVMIIQFILPDIIK